MKKLAKKIVAAILWRQVNQLNKKNNFKVIAVVGSIGKTSTKLAIAKVLKAKYKVCYQEGNYNDLISVPLIYFGQEMPSLFNPFAWLGVFWRNSNKTQQPFNFDFVVIELGSDTPGLIQEFKKYLTVDIGVVTSITPEHMETFGTLDAVAKEELFISQMSNLLAVNADLSAKKYIKDLPNTFTYGIYQTADYNLKKDGGKIEIRRSGTKIVDAVAEAVSDAELYSLLAAASVANQLGLSGQEIKAGIKVVEPFAGRMQQLEGVNGSVIIDDSYNSSPEAVKLALKSIYEMKAPQKIALLGNMNELGEFSEQAHTQIGKLCDPKKLDLVLTLGPDANKYLAPSAEAVGCKVQTFEDPYTAGSYLKSVIKSGAVVLVKGSQNGVFAEEAIKQFLANPRDAKKLVRQSDYWLKIKSKAFKR